MRTKPWLFSLLLLAACGAQAPRRQEGTAGGRSPSSVGSDASSSASGSPDAGSTPSDASAVSVVDGQAAPIVREDAHVSEAGATLDGGGPACLGSDCDAAPGCSGNCSDAGGGEPCPNCFRFVPIGLGFRRTPLPDDAVLLDIDADSRPELLTVGSYTYSSVNAWHSPTGARDAWRHSTFTNLHSSGYEAGLAVGDLNGDGLLDLVTVGTCMASWRQQSPKGRWTDRIISWSMSEACEAQVKHPRLADIDADGDLDVIAVAAGAQRALWWENRVTTGVEAPWVRHDVPTREGPTNCDVADADADGDLDILVSAEDPGSVSLLVNMNGKGTTWEERSVARGLDRPDQARFAAFDAGSAPAIVVSSRRGLQRFSRRAPADPSYTGAVLYGAGVGIGPQDFPDAWRVSPVDFDGDGDLDLVGLLGFTRYPAWWENTGDGRRFVSHVIARVETSFFAEVRALDYDIDGDLDMVVLQPAWAAAVVLQRTACESGRCDLPECVEGESRCERVTIDETLPSFSSYSDIREAASVCEGGAFVSTACYEVCSDRGRAIATCADPVCSPSTRGCLADGLSSGLCSEDGTQWLDVRACATSEHCVEGRCAPPACKGFFQRCADEQHVAECATHTPQWVQKACPADQRCVESGTSATCQPRSCTPSKQTCERDEVRPCNAAGTAFEPAVRDCAAAGMICHEARCVDRYAFETPSNDFRIFTSIESEIRGNSMKMRVDRRLRRITMSVGASFALRLRWVVYEGTSDVGLSRQYESAPFELSTLGFTELTSPELNLPLRAGRHYIIGLHFEGPTEDTGRGAAARIVGSAAQGVSFASEIEGVFRAEFAIPPSTLSVTGGPTWTVWQRLELEPF